MSDVNQPGNPLFVGENAEHEALIERFEDAWQSGEPPKIVEFLRDAGARRAETLIELVHVDLECRLKLGDAARVEKYLDKYPELAADPEIAMSLIATEHEIRSRRDDVSVAEFQERFPQYSDDLDARLASESPSARDTASVHAAEDTFVQGVERSDGEDDPTIGRQFRDYRIVEKIGEGGMGSVYRAVHERLGKTVALKMLPDALLRDEQAAARFDREMLAIGKLDHPNIVRATDAGEANGRHFLVMELVDGVDVASLASRLEHLPAAEACEIVRQAAIGLQHIHEHGLVHRDLKPSNLMLAAGDRTRNSTGVKLLDLGLARLQEPSSQEQERPLTGTGQLMGTFDYMAPEQTMGGDVDIRADIYSLGSTLYRLLAGRAPFAGDEHVAPARKIIALAQQEPTPIRELRGDVPEELVAVLDRMLAKNPADRFQTPAEVATALTPFCDGVNLTRLLVEGTAEHSARTPDKSETHPARVSRKTRRRKPTFVAVAASFLAIFAVAAVIIHFQTAEGEWRLTMLEPGQEVTIREGDKIVEQMEVESKDDVMTARIGEYEVVVHDADGEVVMEGMVEFLRGDQAIARLNRVTDTSIPIRPVPPDPVAGFPVANFQPGQPMSRMALVRNPAPVAGVLSWTIEPIWSGAAMFPSDIPPAAALTDDGSRIATFGEDATIRIWDSRRGPEPLKLQQVLLGHAAGPGVSRSPSQTVAVGARTAMSWSHDGQLLATACQDGSIRVWNVSAGRSRVLFQGEPEELYEIEWSPDGTLLAAICTDSTVRIWRRADWREAIGSGFIVEDQERAQPAVIEWSPDGTALAATILGADSILLWFAESGERNRLADVSGSRFHPVLGSNFPPAIAWSPDSRLIGGLNRDVVQIWDADTRDEQSRFTVETPVALTALRFSPDGRTLAIGHREAPAGQSAVGLYSVESAEKVGELGDVDPGPIYQIDWSPDGTELLTNSFKGFDLWNAATHEHLQDFGVQGGWSFASRGWETLVLGISHHVWHSADQNSNSYEKIGYLRQRRFRPHSLALSPDFRQLALRSQSRDPDVIDLVDRRVSHYSDILESSENSRKMHPGALAWSRASDAIAFVQFSTRVEALPHVLTTDWWEQPFNVPVRADGDASGTGMLQSCAWHADGKRLYGIHSQSIVVYDAATGESAPLLELDNPVGSRSFLALSPDGERLALFVSSSVLVVDANSGELTGEFGAPVERRLFLQAKWSPDGNMLCTVHDRDYEPRKLTIWDAGSFEPKHIIELDVSAMAFVDHQTAVLYTRDGSVRSLNLESGEIAVRAENVGTGSRVSEIFRDGTALVEVHADRIYVHNLNSPSESSTILPPGDLSSRDWAVISPSGHYRSSANITDAIVYVIQTANGQRTLTPEDFANEYGWRNDPDAAR